MRLLCRELPQMAERTVGSGFLYVRPASKQSSGRRLSWGRLPPAKIDSWGDEFIWRGTRNPVAYLAVPAAIDFLEQVGLEAFCARTHWLANMPGEPVELDPARANRARRFGLVWQHGACAAFHDETQRDLRRFQSAATHHLATVWDRSAHRRFPRHGGTFAVSCHLYNDTSQIDRLVRALGQLLAEGD